MPLPRAQRSTESTFSKRSRRGMSLPVRAPPRSGLGSSERSVRSVLMAEPFAREEPGSASRTEVDVTYAWSDRGNCAKVRGGADLAPGGEVPLRVRSCAKRDGPRLPCGGFRPGPQARIQGTTAAIATGTADTGSDVTMGPVIDRVAVLLAESEPARLTLDEVTAGLLPARFVVSDRGTRVLERAVALDDEPRPLMGRLTPVRGPRARARYARCVPRRVYFRARRQLRDRRRRCGDWQDEAASGVRGASEKASSNFEGARGSRRAGGFELVACRRLGSSCDRRSS